MILYLFRNFMNQNLIWGTNDPKSNNVLDDSSKYECRFNSSPGNKKLKILNFSIDFDKNYDIITMSIKFWNLNDSFLMAR